MFIVKDIYDMDCDELLDYRSKVQAEIDFLDEHEPTDPETDEYVEWGEAHEELEYLLADIDDLLDDMD